MHTLRFARALSVISLMLLSACERAPLTYMTSAGVSSRSIMHLGWGLAVISCAVILLVTWLVVWGSLRRRQRPGGLDEVVRPGGGLLWIYAGAGISTIALFICAIWSVVVLARVAYPPTSPKIIVDVIGHQWWWEIRYEGEPASRSFVTANELHVPVGEPVQVRLTSADVIHSFWVPQLAGKTDTIPGQTNQTWLQADIPGTFYGQCTEYCGLQHAHMGLVVVAEPSDRFATWWTQQLSAPPSPGGLAAEGQTVFMARCASCHSVRGTTAGGIFGPDLSHIAHRSRVPSGVLSNSPQNLAAWISHPQGIKPGALMPDPALKGHELEAVVAYLETLQ